MWLLGTAGQDFARARLEARLSAAIPGSVAIGALQTDFLTGAVLEDVVLRSPDGTEGMRAARVELTGGPLGPYNVDVRGLDGTLGIDRDGAITWRDAVGPLPPLPDVAIASVSVEGRLDLDVGGFQGALEGLVLTGSGGTAPLEARDLVGRARLVTALGGVDLDGTGSVSWDTELVAALDARVDGRPVELRAVARDPFGHGGLAASVNGGGLLPDPFRGEVQAGVEVTGDYDRLAIAATSEGAVQVGLGGDLDLTDPAWPVSLHGPVAFGALFPSLPEGTHVEGDLQARATLEPGSTASGALKGSIRAAGLHFPSSDLRFEADPEGLRLPELDLRGAHRAWGSAELGWTDLRAADLSLSADLGALAAIGLPAGITGTLAGHASVASGRLTGDVALANVTHRGFAIPTAHGPLRGELGPTWGLDATAVLDLPTLGGRGLAVEDAHLPLHVTWAPGGALRASGTGTAAHADLLGVSTLNAPRAQATLVAQPGVPLVASGRLTGGTLHVASVPITGLEAEGRLHGDAFTGSVRAESRFADVSTGVSGDLLGGDLALTGTTLALADGSSWTQDGEAGAHLGADGLGSVRVHLVSDLGRIALSGDLARERALVVHAEAARAVADLAGHTVVDGTLAIVDQEPRFDGRWTVDGLEAASTALGALAGELTLADRRLAVRGEGRILDEPVAVEAEVGTAVDGGLDREAPWALHLLASPSDGALGETVRISGGVAVTGTPDDSTVEGELLVLHADTVLGQLALSGSADHVQLDGSAWDGLARVVGRVDTGLHDALEGRARAPTGQLDATADLPWSRLLPSTLPSDRVSGQLTARASATLDGWTVTPTATWSTRGNIGLHAVEGSGELADSRTVPASPRDSLVGALRIGPGTLDVRAGLGGPMDLRRWPTGTLEVTGQGLPLSLVEVLDPELADVTGTFAVDLHGTLDHPVGALSLEGGHLRHRFFGVQVDDLAVAASVDGRTLETRVGAGLRSARQRSGRAGRLDLTITGEIVGGVAHPDLALRSGHVDLHDAVVLARSRQSMRLTTPAPLELGGSLRHPTVRGQIEVDEASVALDRALLVEAGLWGAGPRQIDPRIRLVQDGVDVPRTHDRTAPLWSALDADLEVDLGRLTEGSFALPYLDGLGSLAATASRIRVDARLLGSMRVRVAEGEAQADGSVDVADATAELGGSTFQIERAKLSFLGGELLQPHVLAAGWAGMGGGVGVDLYLRGTPTETLVNLSSAELDDSETWVAAMTGTNPKTARSSFSTATSLAIAVLVGPLFDRVDSGVWQFAEGGLQGRFRVGENAVLSPWVGPIDASLTGIYAPTPNLRLSAELGWNNQAISAGWRRRY
ncbi:MAG: hypothetical protein R3F61_34175 [Myxococcota bacterium]